MSEATKLYRIFLSGKGRKYEGRIFVRLTSYMISCHKMLQKANAEFMGSYMLPEGQETTLLKKLDDLSIKDQARSLRDRIPVIASDAVHLKIGALFDFGGDIGRKKITGISQPFTPGEISPHDARLITGQEVVYVYNANAPKSSKPVSQWTRAQKAIEAAIIERDKTRIPVERDSVCVGQDIGKGKQQVEITSLGTHWKLKDMDVDRLKQRFGIEFEMGTWVQFAYFDAPVSEHEPEKQENSQAEFAL